MKKIIFLVFLGILLTIGGLFIAYPVIPQGIALIILEQQKFIRWPRTAAKKWGREKFNPNSFKNNLTIRASQVADLMDSGFFVGKSSGFVKETLGPPDGDYFNDDTVLTYRIIDDGHEKWDVVFRHDRAGTITGVAAYRVCCSPLEDWLLSLDHK